MKLRTVCTTLLASIGLIAPLLVPDVVEAKGDPIESIDRVADTAAGCSQTPATGVSVIWMLSGGRLRQARVYVPTSWSGGSYLPTVLNWHGLGSTGLEQASVSGYEALAEREGFMVVHPWGQWSVNAGTTDVVGLNWEIFEWQDPTRNDVTFADDLITRLINNRCADASRIYSTGMSNGGYFTARLLCELEDRIAAGVSVSASYFPDGCRPSRAVPFRAYHGTDDRVVGFHGGSSPVLKSIANPPPRAIALFEQHIDRQFARFADAAGCDPDATERVVAGEVVVLEHESCPGRSARELFVIRRGEHEWFRDPSTVDVTVDGWEFMSQFSLP